MTLDEALAWRLVTNQRYQRETLDLVGRIMDCDVPLNSEEEPWGFPPSALARLNP